jgi:hypothetical protein
VGHWVLALINRWSEPPQLAGDLRPFSYDRYLEDLHKVVVAAGITRRIATHSPRRAGAIDSARALPADEALKELLSSGRQLRQWDTYSTSHRQRQERVNRLQRAVREAEANLRTAPRSRGVESSTDLASALAEYRRDSPNAVSRPSLPASEVRWRTS